MTPDGARVGVVIPAYRVTPHILDVIARIGPVADRIYVVDDRCPDGSGAHVRAHVTDSRVRVLQHAENQGVGGATITGYKAALADGLDLVVKLDGDGQMDPVHLDRLLAPLSRGLADYTKGNRFHAPQLLKTMPWVRLVGNSALSFINKAVSGYWHVMDPTNGYTAINRCALQSLPLDDIDRRYFFESDMLFRLALARAVVWDVPLPAFYGDERSNLHVRRTLLEFPAKYVTRFSKRMLYSYFVRDFNVGSIWWITSAVCFGFSATFGGYHWWKSSQLGQPATAGTVMVAAMPVLLGFQSLIGALGIDVANAPTRPLRDVMGTLTERPAVAAPVTLEIVDR